MKEKPYTLVVIDMQSYFTAANRKQTVAAVKREILKAKRKKYPIIFLEYLDYGPTKAGLLRLVSGYRPDSIRVVKDDMSGSDEVNLVVTHFGWPRNLYICGVNTSACVQSTIEGLQLRLRTMGRGIAIMKAPHLL